jgi:hypothetical protein
MLANFVDDEASHVITGILDCALNGSAAMSDLADINVQVLQNRALVVTGPERGSKRLIAKMVPRPCSS